MEKYQKEQFEQEVRKNKTNWLELSLRDFANLFRPLTSSIGTWSTFGICLAGSIF